MGQNVLSRNVRGRNVWSQNVWGQNFWSQNVLGQNVWGQNVWSQNVWGQNVLGRNVTGPNCLRPNHDKPLCHSVPNVMSQKVTVQKVLGHVQGPKCNGPNRLSDVGCSFLTDADLRFAPLWSLYGFNRFGPIWANSTTCGDTVVLWTRPGKV